jgi:transcriptional regulator NrdR family protein
MIAAGKKQLIPFNRDKLLISVYTSMTHRSKPLQDAPGITSTIISHLLQTNHKGVLTTSEIATTAYTTLGRFDKAAATFYKAHHSSLF